MIKKKKKKMRNKLADLADLRLGVNTKLLYTGVPGGKCKTSGECSLC
jgi:hypothetical protein